MVSRNDYSLASGKANEFDNEAIQYRKNLQDEEMKLKELTTTFHEAQEGWKEKKIELEKRSTTCRRVSFRVC